MKNIETLLGKIDTALAMKQVAAIVKNANQRKIDNRDTIRTLLYEMECSMSAHEDLTLFNVYDVMKWVNKHYGGELLTLQHLQGVNNVILSLEFKRSKIDVVLTVGGIFNVKKVDVLWWHGSVLKSDYTFYPQDDGDWVFTDFKTGSDKVIPCWPKHYA